MSDKPLIPTISETVGPEELNQLREKLYELEDRVSSKEMSLEDQLRTLQIRETEQRIQIRQLVLIIGVAVLVVMAILAAHSMHKVMWGHILTVPRSYAIALIVAPIASITTITVALLVGAFRRFRESDADAIPGLATEVTKAGFGAG